MWFLVPFYSTPSAWRQPHGLSGLSGAEKLSMVVDTPHGSSGQLSRPARTASLTRSPSPAAVVKASPACTSHRPTPRVPPEA